MKGKGKIKSILKDILILLSVWIPLLFFVIGGITFLNDGFDGTIMEELFPALFMGFVVFVSWLLILSNIFKRSSLPVWIIPSAILFIITVVSHSLGYETLFLIVLIGSISLLLLLVLIQWVSDWFKSL